MLCPLKYFQLSHVFLNVCSNQDLAKCYILYLTKVLGVERCVRV